MFDVLAYHLLSQNSFLPLSFSIHAFHHFLVFISTVLGVSPLVSTACVRMDLLFLFNFVFCHTGLVSF
jgi:hypothetical protein